MANRVNRQVHYHPFFFLLMALVAMAELILTGFLIEEGNEHNDWLSPRFHSLLIYCCVNSVWTMVFAISYVLWIIDGAAHILASIASSVIWLLVNSILWLVAAVLVHRSRRGGNCAGMPTISRCRQYLTTEALCWTELGLSLFTLFATCLWMRSSKRGYRSSFYGS
ncbi:hypothetical protein BD410DRAFT_780958 [Rickenella mellea]|uniref:MARVEL domain-containing protein n=1 Tax=Rickenella mellea TaxID=50990 RepID=A0A4Y7QMH5_9AGAM|nr:hypothetical protein BD410DRAFT_780958 [Rickenella mellea]